MAQDTANATQHAELEHRGTGAKWLRTPHTQYNALSKQGGE